MSTEITTSSSNTTMGDARRLVFDVILALKSGAMDPQAGMAIAANMKVLNDNMFAEIAAAKMSLQLGAPPALGKRLIG